MRQPNPDLRAPEPILVPALKVGAMTGCSGFAVGGVAAVLRSTPTVGLFALGSGLNCFALGSTYWAVRSTMLRALHDPCAGDDAVDITSKEKVYVSGISGSLTGFTLGFLLRGRPNAIPGAIVWGLAGMGGQYVYSVADARHTQSVTSGANKAAEDNASSLWKRALRSKWSPVKKLTNEEYEKMLMGKLLAVKAEIAITNEEIDKLENVQRKSDREL